MTTIRHCSILHFGKGASNQAVTPGITRPLPVSYVSWVAKEGGRLQRLSQIFKNADFFRKRYPYKTKNNCLVMRFSPKTTKKTSFSFHLFGKQTHTKKTTNKQDKINKQTHE